MSPLRRFVDPFLATGLGLLTVSICVYFASRGFNSGFVDMGHDGYQLREAIDLHQGGMVFRDTFDQYGPVSAYLNLAGFLLLGKRLLAIKLFVSLWYGATAMVMYALARQYLGRALSLFSVLVWIALAPFYQHGIMLSPHAYALPVQAAAMLALVNYERSRQVALLVAVGVLCGIGILMKQSLGVLFLLSVLSYFGMLAWADRTPKGELLRRVLIVGGASGAVLVIMLAWLARHHALGDWYRQTILFPRIFYLATSNIPNAGPLTPWKAFFALQALADWYWLVLRAVVIAGAIVALRHRNPGREKLVLAGSVTLLLWFAAFPSANYMHQWWTTSLSISAAVSVIAAACSIVLRRVAAPLEGAAPALAAALVVWLIWPGLAVRVEAAKRRADISATITEPRSISGIRTDARIKVRLGRLYQTMVRYRQRHPGTPVLSLDASDGATTGIAESLLLLSFFDDTPHPAPIYWNLPVLSSIVYPEYQTQFWKFVRQRKPLLVDYRLDGIPSQTISGYYVLATERSLEGRWLVFAPEHDEAEAHGEPAVMFSERRIMDYVRIPIDGVEQDAKVSIWPPSEEFPIDDMPLWMPTDPGTPLYLAQELRRTGIGMSVNGPVAGKYSYLLSLGERSRMKGAYFFATGVVDKGGFTIGLQRRDHWVGYVNIDRPGPFAVVVVAPDSAPYSLVLANCVNGTFSDRLLASGLRVAVDGLMHRDILNVFHIDRAGWMQPTIGGTQEP